MALLTREESGRIGSDPELDGLRGSDGYFSEAASDRYATRCLYPSWPTI